MGEMDVLEAIVTRRSVGVVKPDPVDRGLIEQLLTAAVWAPNHHRTEPWRFIVLAGEGRNVLGQAYFDIAAEGAGGDPEQLAALKEKQYKKARRAPVVIAVVVSPSAREDVPVTEERAAVHACMQNMLLAAHALGLGAIWRTGAPVYHPRMKAAFGLAEREELAGLVYVGIPEQMPAPPVRTDAALKTAWIDQG